MKPNCLIASLALAIAATTPLPSLSADEPTAAVADVKGARALVRAIETARDGQTIRVAAGRYDLRDVPIRASVTIIGAGAEETIFFAGDQVAKGVLVPQRGASVVIRNVGFQSARSPDRNGAGIRHEGRDLTVIDTIFNMNENAILATGEASGAITLNRVAVRDSGHGDGYSHGVYISSGRRLVVVDSEFIGTRIGHHVKSLAGETFVLNSRFDDAGAPTSYVVDASRGGSVVIEGNDITQSESAENTTLFNYDLTRGGQATRLAIRHNRISNAHPNGVFLRNDTALEPDIQGNDFIAERRGRLKMPK